MIGSFDSLALWLHLFSLCDGWVRYRGVIKSKSKTKICTHNFFFFLILFMGSVKWKGEKIS